MDTKVEHNNPGGVLHRSYTKKISNSLEIIAKVLLSIPSTLIALAAALSQCKEDFNEQVIHIPCEVFLKVDFTQFYL